MTRRVHNKKKPFTVYAGRPGPWGNPYSHKTGTLAKYLVATREEAVSKHREMVIANPALIARAKRELKGEVLGCWCNDDQACHCDNLIDAAEGRLDVVDIA